MMECESARVAVVRGSMQMEPVAGWLPSTALLFVEHPEDGALLFSGAGRYLSLWDAASKRRLAVLVMDEVLSIGGIVQHHCYDDVSGSINVLVHGASLLFHVKVSLD